METTLNLNQEPKKSETNKTVKNPDIKLVFDPEKAYNEIMFHLKQIENSVFKNEELTNSLVGEVNKILDRATPTGTNKPYTSRAPKQNMQIKDLHDGAKGVNISAKIVEIGTPREVKTANGPKTIVEAVLADETGTIKLNLWDEEIKKVKQNDQVTIQNAYVTSYKGAIQLNIGKFGKLTVT